MTILKKGSKGSAVKGLQTQLNKAGAKPKLKVDGLFGPLTDKAVRTYQKKNKLKVDGLAGPYTFASLNFGGPLPEMKVPDHQKRQKVFQKTWQANSKNINSYIKMQSDAAKLAAIAHKEILLPMKLFRENHALWSKVADLGYKIISQQAEFKTILTKSPTKAAKLAKDCEALEKQIEAIGNSKISPNVRKAAAGLAVIRKKLEDTTRLITSELAAIDKRKKAW